MWFGVGAGILAVIALVGVLALERVAFGPSADNAGHERWWFWATAVPAYFLLQLFAEAALEGFSGAHSKVVKAVPVMLLVLFYVAYFAFIK